MKKILEIIIWFILAICACIYFTNLWISIIFLFFHELAHYMTGRMLGYNLKSISLLPFGMRFGFKEEFFRPCDDVIISVAGPLINFLFFVLFLCLKNYSNNFVLLMNINIALCLFNLVPAGFLDGGRILKVMLSGNISFYKGQLITNLNGMIFGFLILMLTLASTFDLQKILLLLMGAFFIYKSIFNIKNITINIINDLLYKQNHFNFGKKFIITSVIYSEEVKILDIIKNFCFNKYSFIYIMDNGYLRYNINETDMIKIYCTYGNIILKDCFNYMDPQEGYLYNGKDK